jgi:hypothetical protein
MMNIFLNSRTMKKAKRVRSAPETNGNIPESADSTSKTKEKYPESADSISKTKEKYPESADSAHYVKAADIPAQSHATLLKCTVQ